MPLAHGIEDRLLTPAAMDDVGLDHPARLLNAPAVAWHEDRFRAVEQLLQRAHVVRHAALGRGDDSRVPGHHVIAAEQDVAVGLCEAEVIRRVTRCEQRFEAPIRAGDHVAVL